MKINVHSCGKGEVVDIIRADDLTDEQQRLYEDWVDVSPEFFIHDGELYDLLDCAEPNFFMKHSASLSNWDCVILLTARTGLLVNRIKGKKQVMVVGFDSDEDLI